MVYNGNGEIISMDDNIASQFSETADYEAGDYVLKKVGNLGRNILYKFKAAHAAGAWTGTDAEAVTVADELSSKANAVGEAPYIAAGDLISSDGKTVQAPYLARPVPADASNRMQLQKVIGGTVVRNQQNNTSTATATVNGVTWTNNGDGTWTADGTATGGDSIFRVGYYTRLANHVYMVYGCPAGGSMSTYYVGPGDAGSGILVKGTTTTGVAVSARIVDGVTVSNLKFFCNIVDITQMFGTTIADYIYSLETATAGAGVAWLKQYFPQFFDAGYLPYNTGELVSVSGLVSHDQLDANGNLIKSYPLDSSLTLRGILKLDASNRPYFNGDEYLPSGSVKRKMVQVTLDGSEAWRNSSTGNSTYYAVKIGDLNSVVSGVCISDKYESVTISGSTTDTGVDIINSSTFNEARIAIRPADVANVSLTDFKAQLAAKPVTVVYEIVTPTTENANPYAENQACEAGGTEQFVIDLQAGLVSSVGNVSVYMESLKNKLANMPPIPSLDEPLTKTLVLNGTEDWTLGTSYTNVQRFDLAGAFKDYTDADHPRGVATVSKGVWTQEATFAGITELSLCFAYGTSPKLYVLVPKSENITVEYAASGNYVLSATINNGATTYAWMLDD